MGTPRALDIGDSLQQVADQTATVLVKLVVFLLVMLVGWLIARVVRKLVDRLLDKVGFNRMAHRTGLERWTGRYRASELAATLVYYAILLIALQLGFGLFGPNPISDLIGSIIAWLPHLFVAVIIIVVAVAIAGAVFDLLSSALSSRSYGRALARAGQVAIIAFGAIAALNQVGVATTVTTPILITVLATVGGVVVVGLGGGLIGPMRQRWERILARVEAEGTGGGGAPGEPAGEPTGDAGH